MPPKIPVYDKASQKKPVGHIDIESPNEPAPLEERIQKERDTVLEARDQVRFQLNGLENQLYILNQLLDPSPEPAKDVSEETPTEPGTI